MTWKMNIFRLAMLAINVTMILSHGRVIDPAHRGYAWRLNFDTPRNYDDMGNYCGGIQAQYEYNGGRCGVCGDNYTDEQPRDNENGGLYGTGTIIKTYEAGSEIDVTVELTAAHKGDFEFSLCPLKNHKDLETEECFNDHQLQLAKGGGYKFTDVDTSKNYTIQLKLPQNLTCEHCVFRWHYRTGNNWNDCGNSTGLNGCGNQETFRTCSDIKIV